MDHALIRSRLQVLAREIREAHKAYRFPATQGVYLPVDADSPAGLQLTARIEDWERRGTAIRQHIEKELAELRVWNDPVSKLPSRYRTPPPVSRYRGPPIVSRYRAVRADRRRDRDRRAAVDAALTEPFAEYAVALSALARDLTDRRGKMHDVFKAFQEVAGQFEASAKAGESLTAMQQAKLQETAKTILQKSPGADTGGVKVGGYAPVLATAIIGAVILRAGAEILASIKEALKA